MIHYIFDVDGTLTPSHSAMDDKFSSFFYDFSMIKNVYLVTGSNKEKTIEQVGELIWEQVEKNYQCSGNDVWQDNVCVKSGVLVLPNEIWGDFNFEITSSKFPIRAGNHIEERPGLCNLSIVGRDANNAQRKEYVAWDQQTEERKTIANRLKEKFPEFEFKVAGETGIDITTKGNDKSQILEDFSHEDIIYFYGDRTEVRGNDHEIALAVNDRGGDNRVFTVKDWKDTFNYLQSLKSVV
jgi:phosphomannomutase